MKKTIDWKYLTLCRLKHKKSLKLCLFLQYGVVPPNRNLYLDEYKQSAINYGVSKSAQIHLTKELAVRYSKQR